VCAAAAPRGSGCRRRLESPRRAASDQPEQDQEHDSTHRTATKLVERARGTASSASREDESDQDAPTKADEDVAPDDHPTADEAKPASRRCARSRARAAGFHGHVVTSHGDAWFGKRTRASPDGSPGGARTRRESTELGEDRGHPVSMRSSGDVLRSAILGAERLTSLSPGDRSRRAAMMSARRASDPPKHSRRTGLAGAVGDRTAQQPILGAPRCEMSLVASLENSAFVGSVLGAG